MRAGIWKLDDTLETEIGEGVETADERGLTRMGRIGTDQESRKWEGNDEPPGPRGGRRARRNYEEGSMGASASGGCLCMRKCWVLFLVSYLTAQVLKRIILMSHNLSGC